MTFSFLRSHNTLARCAATVSQPPANKPTRRIISGWSLATVYVHKFGRSLLNGSPSRGFASFMAQQKEMQTSSILIMSLARLALCHGSFQPFTRSRSLKLMLLQENQSADAMDFARNASPMSQEFSSVNCLKFYNFSRNLCWLFYRKNHPQQSIKSFPRLRWQRCIKQEDRSRRFQERRFCLLVRWHSYRGWTRKSFLRRSNRRHFPLEGRKLQHEWNWSTSQ